MPSFLADFSQKEWEGIDSPKKYPLGAIFNAFAFKATCAEGNILLYRGLLLGICREVLEVSVDEAVDLAVHYRVDVTVLKAGSRVLGEGVGHEYVASDLAAPFNVRLITLNVLDPVELLAELDLHELCL